VLPRRVIAKQVRGVDGERPPALRSKWLFALSRGVCCIEREPPNIRPAIMETTTENAVIEKTRELCQTILDQPEYQAIRKQVDAFMSDEAAQAQYQMLASKGEYLQHKQAQSLPLSGEEIAEYESHREKFFNNPVARDFVGAQQSIHKMQETVAQYVAKTFELGRIPEADDFDSGGCGPTCGCGH
jgi:cell fate (sporulation/competence/biofilm development) regulator YlbF (YheA/YmcA/DUF963 family)